jgi:hypothetical protein
MSRNKLANGAKASEPAQISPVASPANAQSSPAAGAAPEGESALALFKEAVAMIQKGYDLSGDPGLGSYLKRANPAIAALERDALDAQQKVSS